MCDKSEASCMIATPLGNYEIRTCSKGVHGISHIKQALDFEKDKSLNLENNEGDQRSRVTTSNQEGSEPKLTSDSRGKEVLLDKCKSWLINYFENPNGSPIQYLVGCPEICLDSSKYTEFEKLVWKNLKESTVIGDTISYGKLATAVGKPKAARAVGTALKKNPIAILVPCHRVVRSDGNLGNYSGGSRNEAKKWLYDHEQAAVKKL